MYLFCQGYLGTSHNPLPRDAHRWGLTPVRLPFCSELFCELRQCFREVRRLAWVVGKVV